MLRCGESRRLDQEGCSSLSQVPRRLGLGIYKWGDVMIGPIR